MRILAPAALAASVLLWLGALPPAPPQSPAPVRALPAPMDVVYYKEGDVNYSYGPRGDDLNNLVFNAAPATIAVTYDANFNANPAAQAAFQAAVNIWANVISSPAVIRVSAAFANLGTNILGSAGPSLACTTSVDPNNFYAAALADKLNGSQSCAALGAKTAEINASFSSGFASWDFGTTGVGVPGKVNFMTVVLHELGHGLGFFGSFTSNGTTGSFSTPLPFIFDRFAINNVGTPLLSFVNPSAALHAQLTSDNTYFNGNTARGNNGGINPKLETHNFNTFYGIASANNGWLQGSSFSHTDDVLYTATPNGLMTWQLNSNEVYTDPGPIVRGIFQDIGWTITPLGGNCTFTLNPTSASAAATASTGNTVTVTTQTGCPWTATSNAPFITITGGASGNGNGTVTYSVAANTLTSQRAGSMTIAGQTFTVTQAGRPPRAVASDFDGDGKSDFVVWRAVNGTFFWLLSSNNNNPATAGVKQWGNQSLGDVPFLGDIDGDGLSDLIVWRASTGFWFWLTSSTGYNYANQGQKQWGAQSQGDIPMIGDIDGDGKVDLIVWRASTGTFFWLTSSTGYNYANQGQKQWGNQSLGDKPFLGDFDGDGKSDLVVWRASTGFWFWLTSSTGYNYANQAQKQWGSQGAGDVPMLGDIDGDGKSDLVVWRAPTGTWFWITSSTGYNYANQGQKAWGSQAQGDVPVLPDLDGDGKADLTVWRPGSGSWFWLTSASAYATPGTTVNWGAQSQADIPIDR